LSFGFFVRELFYFYVISGLQFLIGFFGSLENLVMLFQFVVDFAAVSADFPP
jgi:hypothetical protein